MRYLVIENSFKKKKRKTMRILNNQGSKVRKIALISSATIWGPEEVKKIIKMEKRVFENWGLQNAENSGKK